MASDATVGPYRILRLINRGGQGSVYLGYDQRLQRRVAIKIYRLPAGRDARKRLLHEARLVAGMQSPKVVQVHDVIQSSEHLAMVMEYVPGCDLEELLASVRPSIASVLGIAADIAGALTIARQQHVIHGDLKAGNVLVADNGRVKLTDFGIARSPAGEPFAAGSLASISPEQYRGRPCDHRSDLFALGCLIYRMVSGLHPFYSGGEFDGRRLTHGAPAALEERTSPDVELPPGLSDLVDALLQKEPADRPADTRVVRQALRRIARHIPLSAGDRLLEEARPCFRPESPVDLPLDVPPDLGRRGRSRLANPERGLVGIWRRAGRRGWHWPIALGGLALAVSLAWAVSLYPRETLFQVGAPVLRLSPGADLPAAISSRWLVEQVTEVAAERLGPLRVSGPVGVIPVTTLYATPHSLEPEGPAQEQLQLDLRCLDTICVLAMTRTSRGQQSNRQAMLFTDMAIGQWRDIVRTTTRALYP